MSDFKPLPLLGNPHVQTLLGHLLRGPSVKLPTQRRVLWLPDGDGLVLHDTIPPGWAPGGAIAVLVHGLSGSHASGGIQRLAVLLLERGARVVRLDQRGAGAGLSLARRCYHAGRSDDLRLVLGEVHRWDPTAPLLLAGVSLGGNVSLKLTGEVAERPIPGLARVAVISPPIDMEPLFRSALRIDEIGYMRVDFSPICSAKPANATASSRTSRRCGFPEPHDRASLR